VCVLAVATAGGVTVGVLTALTAFALENYYFVPPVHTFTVARPDDFVALVAFLVFAVVASVSMTTFLRRSQEAERARAEARILAQAAATAVTTDDDLVPLLAAIRAVFGVSRAELMRLSEGEWRSEAASGEPVDDDTHAARFTIDDEHHLLLWGPTLDMEKHGLLGAFVDRIGAGLRAQRLQREADAVLVRAEADALRTGLLRAVSHDLRTPLATIEANVSTLLERDVDWSPSEVQSFLVTIEREVHRLTRLTTNLLDAGRLEAKVVTPRMVEVDLEEMVATALETIDTRERVLDIDIRDDLPRLVTDPDLVERVIANVVANACRFSPVDEPVRIRAGATSTHVELLVIDRGPGIRPEQRQASLEPFQRLTDDRVGSGLGLSVANGFLDLLGGELRMDDTPAGGLTVGIALPRKVER